jgi:hypothetical protein
MVRIPIFLLFLLISVNLVGQYGAAGAFHQGFYMIYESMSYDTKLKQKVVSAEFSENYRSEIISYPAVKLGYSFTAWGNLGLMNMDWAIWGVDFGAGLNYNRSIMNALQQNEEPYQVIGFEPTAQNNQVFFNYYQPGNQCVINDYGINLHIDAGSVIYAGAEIDAGPSNILFLDNRIQNQKVRSLGWYANARVQVGLSFPFCIKPLTRRNGNKTFNRDSDVALNLKFYVVPLGWSARFYNLDWIAEDKKLKNFSTLITNSNVLGGGISISVLFLK